MKNERLIPLLLTPEEIRALEYCAGMMRDVEDSFDFLGPKRGPRRREAWKTGQMKLILAIRTTEHRKR